MNPENLQLWLVRFAILYLIITLIWTLVEIAKSTDRKGDLMKLTEKLLSWQVVAGVLAFSNAKTIIQALSH